MPLARIDSSTRPILGFTLEGLTGREETLFKTFVRLLDHRTLQQWVHRPMRPDLRVVADSVALYEGAAPDTDGQSPLRLTISSAPGRRRHCVGLPLRADELEAELNSLGLLRVSGNAARQAAQHPEHASFRLLRWPPAELLGTPERVQFATLMVNKPFTLAWVQQRSNLAPAACAQFFAELRDAALLVPVASIAPKQGEPALAPDAAASSLLARIRSRVGQLVRSASP